MRKLLLITLPLLLIVGCSKEPINYENTLIKRDGLYTNWYENGQKKLEGSAKDDESDGFHIFWDENGKKIWEGTLKRGIIIDDDDGFPYHLIEW